MAGGMKVIATIAPCRRRLGHGRDDACGNAQTGIARLTPAQRHAIKAAGEWHRGCPVWMSELRVLSYRYYGFDKQTHIGQIVVNAKVAQPLAKVFGKLYRLRFPDPGRRLRVDLQLAPGSERRRDRLLRVPQRGGVAV